MKKILLRKIVKSDELHNEENYEENEVENDENFDHLATETSELILELKVLIQIVRKHVLLGSKSA